MSEGIKNQQLDIKERKLHIQFLIVISILRMISQISFSITYKDGNWRKMLSTPQL